jgi:nucleotide-binding universal stress UspA family protein
MFTTIVWATDGSAHADRALGYAGAIAEGDHAALHVVHIVEKLVGGRVAGQDVLIDEARIDAKIKEQAREASAQHGIKTTVHMTPSGIRDIADVVAEVAAQADADLIVVGTRGHSALGGLVLGSVTQRLLHIAACPVLAVPPLKGAHAETPPAAAAAAGATAGAVD